jgi:tetratricopeptide (TPR) repeat protein
MLATSRTFPSSLGHRDDELIAALESAVAALPAGDERRGRLLAQLSMEIATNEPLARRRELADEALDIVRRCGDKRATCVVLLYHLLATWVAHTTDERVAHIDEMLALSEDLDDPILRFHVLSRSVNVIEAGDIVAADARLAEMKAIAERFPQPIIRWIYLYTASSRALFAGELDQAEQLAGEALQVATDSGQPDAMAIYGAGLVQVRWLQGRLGELVDLIAQTVEDNPTLPAFRIVYAQALLQAGRDDEAHGLLSNAAADGFASVPLDMVWSSTLVNCAELAFLLDDRRAAAKLFELLEPHARTVAWSGATIWGSVEGYLGVLATMLGHHDAAVTHLEAAARTHERMGAPLFLAGNHLALATALLRRGDPQDSARIRSLLDGARATAAGSGAAFIEQRAEQLLAEAQGASRA